AFPQLLLAASRTCSQALPSVGSAIISSVDNQIPATGPGISGSSSGGSSSGGSSGISFNTSSIAVTRSSNPLTDDSILVSAASISSSKLLIRANSSSGISNSPITQSPTIPTTNNIYIISKI